MTRAAKDQRAAEAARRGEQEWAVQAYLNLAALLDTPLRDEPRATLERFLRQCPPSIKMIATRVFAQSVGTEAVEIPPADAIDELGARLLTRDDRVVDMDLFPGATDQDKLDAAVTWASAQRDPVTVKLPPRPMNLSDFPMRSGMRVDGAAGTVSFPGES